jgi:hypothetical protein
MRIQAMEQSRSPFNGILVKRNTEKEYQEKLERIGKDKYLTS